MNSGTAWKRNLSHRRRPYQKCANLRGNYQQCYEEIGPTKNTQMIEENLKI